MIRFPIFRNCTGAALLLGGLALTPALQAADAVAPAQATAPAAAPAQPAPPSGKELAFDVRKGNCLACHMITGGEAPGTIAPPLIGMQARFPDKAKLREQIWDSTTRNPETSMPPFGKHGILSEAEIDAIAEFIWSQ